MLRLKNLKVVVSKVVSNLKYGIFYMELESLIINNIKRSEFAYLLYKRNPSYHHAKHIWYANNMVYIGLNDYLGNYQINKEKRELIFAYLFHLEDWFLQYQELEAQFLKEKGEQRKSINLEQEFKFLPFIENIPYPQNFIREFLK